MSSSQERTFMTGGYFVPGIMLLTCDFVSYTVEDYQYFEGSVLDKSMLKPWILRKTK
ncbi:hypothetical protein BU23DRAFT_559592 [Bimuria novae-zelandiae CBS 107.79]|uniref:Uncharacterized protein n=1 Tax=Bimuria novae-zelandiae CBS 107.79 TaxID=1447943 RepID=A0A6A5UQD5_9PLEO|nr:hypothetical protein BU23DRAFT_559592 [Bimuria novae-zelandiae CBS 107.79]